GIPVCFTAYSLFVTRPSHTGTGITEEDHFGLDAAYKVKGSGPIVIGSAVDSADFIAAPIVAIATVGTVKPHFENVTVIGKQFFKLIAVVGDIFRSAILRMVSIPRAHIDTEFETMTTARIRDFF